MDTTYTYDEVKKSTQKYFHNNDLATLTAITKYLEKEKDTYFECNPDDILKKRLAPEFARIEHVYPNSMFEHEIYDAFDHFSCIIPSGGTLFGCGNNKQISSLANCFVVGTPEDSYGGILTKDEELVQIMKRRGGAGISLETIRPKTSLVRNSARSSDGLCVFAERYSNSTKEVAQGGRRGALMIGLDCRHPDLIDFVRLKRDLRKVTSANISIKWHNDFLNAVEKNESYTLRWPVNSSIEDAKITKEVDARSVWYEVIHSAWLTGDPGCMFWDTVINQSISDCYSDIGFETVISNPCGEIPMSAYSACILMLINLTCFVDNPFTSKACINYDKFNKYVPIAVRLIDDLIDLEIEKVDKIIQKIESDPEDLEIKKTELTLWNKIRKNYIAARRVGLGVTGLADMIAMLGMKYGSDECIQFVDDFFKKLHCKVYESSCDLAKERGAFPAWDWNKEKNCHYIKILPIDLQNKIKQYGRRNIAQMTISPAGSTSLIASLHNGFVQITSGIEPLYSYSFTRNRKITQDEINSGIKEDFVDDSGIKWITHKVEHSGILLWKQITGETDISKSPYYNCTAHDLSWKSRVRMQSTIQKYIDHSISSTINLPKTATEEDISDIYMNAWKRKCKGITIYRDNCRKHNVFDKDNKTNSSSNEIVYTMAPKRPIALPCDIHYSNVGQGEWIFFIGFLKGKIYEIFGGSRKNVRVSYRHKNGMIVKAGRDEKGVNTYDFYTEESWLQNGEPTIRNISKVFAPEVCSCTRQVSTQFRHGVPPKIITEQLYKDYASNFFSFERAMARIIKKYIANGEKSYSTCPNCKNKSLQYRDGCIICVQCSWSGCM